MCPSGSVSMTEECESPTGNCDVEMFSFCHCKSWVSLYVCSGFAIVFLVTGMVKIDLASQKHII